MQCYLQNNVPILINIVKIMVHKKLLFLILGQNVKSIDGIQKRIENERELTLFHRYNNLRMQGDEIERYSLQSLIVKIKRLRKRLISYGWNKQEACTFILYEFLKLPEPDWQKPSCTSSFYLIKEKYKTQTATAQLILSLQEIVPNLQTREVLEYLHSVFEYSSLAYGFEIFDSSSDSSENPRIYRKNIRAHRPTRYRPRQREFSPSSRKKIHCEDEKEEAKSSDGEHSEQKKKEQVKIVRKRKFHVTQEGEEWEKTIKKDEN